MVTLTALSLRVQGSAAWWGLYHASGETASVCTEARRHLRGMPYPSLLLGMDPGLAFLDLR